MIDKRMAAGFALVAGLGLASVAAAPVSGAATPSAAHTAAHAQPAKQTAGKDGGKSGGKGGKEVVCIVNVVGKPGKGAPGTLPPLPGKPGKGTRDRIEVKVVNGKVTVYINGKPAPKGSVHIGKGAECPAPPKGLPGAGGVSTGPGKGGVTVHPDEGGVVDQGAEGADEAGLSTAGLPA